MYGYPGLSLVTAPAEEPVTLAEAKLAARISIDDDDALVSALITAARLEVEALTHRQLVTATYDLVLDRFPKGREAIRLPLAPLAWDAGTNYVKYNSAGTITTWDAANYSISQSLEPGRIFPAFGLVWPATRSIEDAVTIRFTCGYGAAADVDERAKVAIKLIVADRYEHREETTEANLRPIPRGAERLIEQLTYGDEFVRYALED